MAHPTQRSPPVQNDDSFRQRMMQKIALFKIAELRAVLRCAGGATSGNKSRVFSLVKHLVSQNDKFAIEKINLIYNNSYGDRVRVPTSSAEERRFSNSIPPKPPTQPADRPGTTPGFQLRQQCYPEVPPDDNSKTIVSPQNISFPDLLGKKISTPFRDVINCHHMLHSLDKRFISFRFYLSARDVKMLREESNLTTRVVFRICKRNYNPITDQVPRGICSFKVNGASVILVQSPEKFEYRHTSRPIDITNQVTKDVCLQNVELYFLPYREAVVSQWYVVIEVLQFDISSLIDKLPIYPYSSTQKRIEQAFKSDSELSITTTSINFSLKCPLTGAPIQLPCRSSSCTHLQCFDGTALIRMGVETHKWLCPICSTPTPYETLLTDSYFSSVVDEAKGSISEIFLFEDGEWSSTSNSKPIKPSCIQIILDCSNSSAPPCSPPGSPFIGSSTATLSIDLVKLTPKINELNTSIIEILD